MKKLFFLFCLIQLSAFAEDYTSWSNFFFTQEVYIEPRCGDCMLNPNDAAARGNQRCFVPEWKDGEFYAKGFEYDFNSNEYVETTGVRVWHYFDWVTQIRQCSGTRN